MCTTMTDGFFFNLFFFFNDTATTEIYTLSLHDALPISDWTASSVLNLSETAGGTRPKPCKPTSGRIEVCNASYGNNGWLGIAQIWITGGVHITQAVTKVNDYYFNQPAYNTPAWRQFVICQEVGHDFGLDHQDENFNNANLGSSMDYTNDPNGGAGGAVNNDPSNEHPNSHDYAQLVTIYSHLDSFSTVGQSTASAPSASDWGHLIRVSVCTCRAAWTDGRSHLGMSSSPRS